MREQQRREADEEKLKRLPNVDSLTGLFNRRHFDAQLAARVGRETDRRDSDRIALLLADLDYFKSYNDRYGHQAGDECLKAVALCIFQAVREAGVVARYGGEEFTVVLDNSGSDGAATIAERVRRAVEALRIRHDGSPLGIVTLSIGIAHASTVDADARALVSRADAALYEAKRAGRNQVR